MYVLQNKSNPLSGYSSTQAAFLRYDDGRRHRAVRVFEHFTRDPSASSVTVIPPYQSPFRFALRGICLALDCYRIYIGGDVSSSVKLMDYSYKKTSVVSYLSLNCRILAAADACRNQMVGRVPKTIAIASLDRA